MYDENKSKGRTAGAYFRVSTGRQEKEATIDSQIDEVKTRIKADENILLPENIFTDDGWSGELLARPKLDELRDACKGKRIEVLYVYDLGRLSRNFTNQLVLLEEIENAGVEIISLHDINPQNEEETLAQRVLGIFHDYERIKIAERMRRGKLYKSRMGILINGQALYGLTYVRKTENRPAYCKINEFETDAVNKIFEWFVIKGYSQRKIIKELYDAKIPPRKRKSEFWTKGPVIRVLTCETYITGVAYYNKSEAVVGKRLKNDEKYRKVKKNSRRVRPKEEWIPIKVPVVLKNQELFYKAQKILEHNQKFACKKRQHTYLLSGFTYCECGNRRVGDGADNGHYYYRCTERILKYPKKNKCKSPGINAEVLDKLFWLNLTGYLSEPKNLKEQVKDWVKTQVSSEVQVREMQRINTLIEKAKEEKQRYIQAYGQGALEFEAFQDAIKPVNQRIKGYEDELEAIKQKSKGVLEDSVPIEEYCAEVKEAFSTLNLSNRALLIRDIIDKIVLKGFKNEVDVYGYLSVAHLNMGYGTTNRNRWVAK